MKLAVGLVVTGGKEFIDKWIESAENIADVIFVVDNGADKEVWSRLAFHPIVNHYHRQIDMGRNQSRDYQKILEMAREENCDWLWNIDIDEIIPIINIKTFKTFLLNCPDNSVGFPLFEMRGDDKHYIAVEDAEGNKKDARVCHKCYKVLSHFKFNEKDIHGVSIPHNCTAGKTVLIPIQHFGHYTKELREEKRKRHSLHSFKDMSEHTNTWLEDDDTKVEIRKWEDFINEKANRLH